MSDHKPKDFQKSADFFKKFQSEFREGLQKRQYLINELQMFITLKQELELLCLKDAPPNMVPNQKEIKKAIIKQLKVLKREITRTEQLIAAVDKRMTSFEKALKTMEKELKDGKII